MDNGQVPPAQPTAPTPTPAPVEPKKKNTGLIIGLVVLAIVIFVVLPCVGFFLIFNGIFQLATSDETQQVIEDIGKEILPEPPPPASAPDPDVGDKSMPVFPERDPGSG